MFISTLCVFPILQCLKESYVKALGVGIGFEVKRLNFSLQDSLGPSLSTELSSGTGAYFCFYLYLVSWL